MGVPAVRFVLRLRGRAHGRDNAPMPAAARARFHP